MLAQSIQETTRESQPHGKLSSKNANTRDGRITQPHSRAVSRQANVELIQVKELYRSMLSRQANRLAGVFAGRTFGHGKLGPELTISSGANAHNRLRFAENLQ